MKRSLGAILTPPLVHSPRARVPYLFTIAGGVYRGKEAVRRYNEHLFEQFESIRFEVDETVWVVRDGLLAERRSYPTKPEALEATGLKE
jgi:hypothetical protein